MKQISHDLQRFILKYFTEPYKEIEKTVKFSSSQKNFIRDFHNIIMKGHYLWAENRKIIQKPVATLMEYKDSHHYSHIPNEFRHTIENTMKIQKTFEFFIENRKYSITFYADSEKTFLSKKWEEYLRKIYIWLYIATQFAYQKCSRILQIYVYLTPHTKMLPSSQTAIGRIHANTAFTTSCTESTEIHLYREEEWFKVLIHETFHSFGLDFSGMTDTDANKQIFAIFGIEGDVRLYESYTETWGELIHICMMVHFSMIKSKEMENIAKYLEKVEKILCFEVMFSMLQCTKVLNHYNLDYTKLCDSLYKSEIAKKYHESTPVFSYYIVKPILLFFANDFIEWTMIQNRGSFDFRKTKTNVNSFVRFIAQHSKSPKYCAIMKMVNDNFQEIKHLDVVGNKTMRMTLFEE